MLPYLEEMNDRISEWLSSPQGRQDLQDMVDAFVDMAHAISDIVGFVLDLKTAWKEATLEIKKYNDENSVFNGTGGGGRGGRRFYGSGGTDNTPTGPTTPADRQPSSAPVIIFNSPIDSVSAGREVSRVLSDFQRSNGGR
jgi:hypothetical protein